MLSDGVSNCYRTQVRFCFRVVCDFFIFFLVCASNILGTAERICAKFTGKTCMVPRSDDLNVKVKGQGHQGRKSAVRSITPATTEWNALVENNIMRQQTGPFRRCGGVFFGRLCAVYVW